MKRVYRMENLDCANCAAKMQEAIAKIDGVESCTINFMTQKLLLEADRERMDDILAHADKAVKRIEPDCMIVR